ncbi:MAG: BON domain-containing protein [Pirellulales bacterium]
MASHMKLCSRRLGLAQALAAACVLLTVHSPQASAQFSGLTSGTSSGMMGGTAASNPGLSASGSISGGTRSLGTGVSAGNRTLSGSNSMSGMMGMTGQASGTARYLRNSTTSGQFIGTDTQDVGAFVGSNQSTSRTGTNRQTGMNGMTGRTGQFGGGQFGNTGRQFGQGGQFGQGQFGQFGGRNGQFGNMGGRNAAPPLQLRLGFTQPPVDTVSTSARIQTQIGRLASVPALTQLGNNVAVSMNGNKVVLSGTVTEASQRDVLERMVKLDPAVGSVDNQIQVVSSSSATTGSGS